MEQLNKKTSPCRASRGLAPPSGCALPGTRYKKGDSIESPYEEVVKKS
ncbi:MAG: hypothetical protein PVJ50_05450 [Desulfobacterales bacterium]